MIACKLHISGFRVSVFSGNHFTCYGARCQFFSSRFLNAMYSSSLQGMLVRGIGGVVVSILQTPTSIDGCDISNFLFSWWFVTFCIVHRTPPFKIAASNKTWICILNSNTSCHAGRHHAFTKKDNITSCYAEHRETFTLKWQGSVLLC